MKKNKIISKKVKLFSKKVLTNGKRCGIICKSSARADEKSAILTQRVHLFPFRTQKLSFAVPTILAWRRAGKIGHGGHP